MGTVRRSGGSQEHYSDKRSIVQRRAKETQWHYAKAELCRRIFTKEAAVPSFNVSRYLLQQVRLQNVRKNQDVLSHLLTPAV